MKIYLIIFDMGWDGTQIIQPAYLNMPEAEAKRAKLQETIPKGSEDEYQIEEIEVV